MGKLFSKPKYYKPGVGGSLLILLVLVVGGGILASVAALAAAAATGELTAQSLSDPAMLTGIMTSQLSLIYFAQMIVPAIFIWLVGNSKSYNPLEAPVKINSPHLGRFSVIPLGVLLLFLTLALGWLLDPLSNYFPMPDNFKDMFENMGNRPFDTILSVAIMAPLFEEFILRGTIERGLLARSYANRNTEEPSQGLVIWAIIWSSVLFGAMHMNLWQAIPAFLIGCLLGWVYYRTHSIWATIFMHFVNNFSSIAMYWLFPQLDAEASSEENIAMLTGSPIWYWVFVGIGGVVTVAGIWLLNKYLPKKPQSFKPKKVFLAQQTPDVNL